MNKPLPKQPHKVSKAKKTLPVEIDWGHGMKDRLRYISPNEEAMIQRNRSTDAERYYGGIRAYPDPGDTAVGTGNWQGAPGSGTTSPGAASGGGSDSGAGTSTSSATSSPAGAGPAAAGVGAGAVSASAAANPGYTGGIGSGVGTAEGALHDAESAYRNGVNSLSDSISSGKIVSTTTPYAKEASSYSYNIPSPVQATGAGDIYGGAVTDDMLPDYGNMMPKPPQHVSAIDSLKGMLANGGTYIGPAKVGPPAPSPVDSTPSTFAYQGALDRLANGTSVVGTTNPVGFEKFADRVPQSATGVNSLTLEDDDNYTDTRRGVNTIASAEGLPEVDVASSITKPVPQTNASAAQSYASMKNPTSFAQGMQSQGVRYSTWNSTAPEFDPTGGIDYQTPDDTAAEKVLSVEDVPEETRSPGKTRGLSTPVEKDQDRLASIAGKTVPMSTVKAQNPAMYDAMVNDPGYAAAMSNPPVFDPNGGAFPRSTASTGGISDINVPSDDASSYPQDEGAGDVLDGMVGDEATKAAQKAGVPRNIAGADWFRDDPSQLGILRDPVDPEAITPTDMAKIHQRSMAQKYDDIDPYLTPDEKTRKGISNAVENFILNRTGPAGMIAKGGRNLMGIEKTEDFLGRPSYEQGALYDYGREADARYGRSNLQGAREGGSDTAAMWAQGIGIPNVNDPSYPTYMYWLNSQGGSSGNWGWS